jgi:hypothetical protein
LRSKIAVSIKGELPGSHPTLKGDFGYAKIRIFFFFPCWGSTCYKLDILTQDYLMPMDTAILSHLASPNFTKSSMTVGAATGWAAAGYVWLAGLCV